MSIASLYPSINPSLLLDFANSKVLDPRITFTRTTTATYYDGVTTAKAEENLYSYSQTFTTWWTSINASLTANSSTAPDGTNTATLMYPSSTGGETIIYPPSTDSTQAYTVSCYAKASGKSYLMLQATASSLARTAWFNLSTGVVGTVGANISSASITSVGSGWYRCAITFTIVGGIRGNIGLSDSDNSFSVTASGTNGILLWGAQLEQRSSVTAYTATTTQAITNYIPVLQTAAAGQARFDHNPTTGESLGLLIEEARTNISLYSSYSAANWAQNSASVTANSVVAPDGTLSAATLIEDTSANYHITYPPGVTNAAATYTASVYLKQAGRRYAAVQIYIDNAASRYTILVDLSNGSFVASNNVGTPTSTSYAITSVGNGWYRVSVTAAQTSNSVVGIVIGASNSATPSYLTGLPTYTGNGWNSIYFWGAQIEAGSFATSYIPTVASSVTRNADAASMTGTNFSSWFNNGEGTVYAEASGKSSASARVAYFSANNDTSNFYNVNFESNAGRWYGAYNGTNQFNISISPYTENAFAKFAGAYKVNDFALSFNASAASTDTSGNLAIGINQLNFGAYPTNAYMLNGTIKKLAYYPTRVTNAQLQALTV